MDDGTASALLALVVGFPILATFLLFGMVGSAVFTGALVGGLAFAFVAIERLGGGIEHDIERPVEVENHDRSRGDPGSAPDPLDELRGRYARGELNDEEFEHRVETLLETETRSDADDYIDGATRGDGAVRDVERVRERY